MSPSAHCSCLSKLPLRTMVFAFFVLTLLVVTDILFTASTRSSMILDVSMRMKTDVSRVFRNLMNSERLDALNGTINGTLVIREASNKDNVSGNLLKLIIDDRGAILMNKNKTDREFIPSFSTESGKATVNDVNVATLQYDILGNPMVKEAKDNQRKDECNNCFGHNFNYVIDNPDICKLKSDQTEIELLIVILTIHKNVLQRNTLRETWLTYSKNNTANIRYAFLLGEVKDSKLQEDVLKESKQFKDIIKEDFVDAYSNLTYKTIMGFKWASTRCNVAKAVMKTDDDMYLNVPNVLNIVRNNSSLLQTNIAGSCSQKAGPIRNEKSKWFASVKSYPGKFYPGYCSGTGYVTSLNVAKKVYEVSPHVPFFHLEDVYVSLCMKKLGYHLKGFPGFNPGRPKLDPCLFNGKRLVTAHYMPPGMIKQMWKSKCVITPAKPKS